MSRPNPYDLGDVRHLLRMMEKRWRWREKERITELLGKARGCWFRDVVPSGRSGKERQ